jgi:hypothetical protein
MNRGQVRFGVPGLDLRRPSLLTRRAARAALLS